MFSWIKIVREWLFGKKLNRTIRKKAKKDPFKKFNARLLLEQLEIRWLPSTTWYVNSAASGDNNGQDWADAYTDLHAAFVNPSLAPGDQIWVAEGTYYAAGTSFSLPANVQVYGGFSGTETSLSQRNFVTNVTILDGGTDGGMYTSTTVVVDNNDTMVPDTGTVLDGFTIQNGNSTFGGGMVVSGDSAPTVSNDIFTTNSAVDGAGMFVDGGTKPNVTNVTFRNNTALLGGYLSGGGGMYVSSGSPTLTNVTFTNNSALNGGGIYDDVGSSTTVMNATFENNSATVDGGGIFNYGASASVTNAIFVSNQASNYGGGIANENTSTTTTVTNATFNNNSATSGGSGIYNDSSSAAAVTNTILWGDNNGEINDASAGNVSVSYSDVEGGAYVGMSAGNINADPQFVGAPADLHLTPGSLAQGAGTNVGAPSTDIDGTPRLPVPDMGAYQIYVPPSTVYVGNPSGFYPASPSNGDSVTWNENPLIPGLVFGYNAFTDIQSAVNAVTSGGTVNVEAGVYYGTGNTTVTGPYVAGAFSGGQTEVAEINIDKPVTIVGPNASYNPNTESAPATDTQAIIEPSVSSPNYIDTAGAPAVIDVLITSSNVTIEGITVSGSNPNLMHYSDSGTYGFVTPNRHIGVVYADGVPVDAAEDIASYSNVGNITIQNNIVEYASLAGIDFMNTNGTTSETATSGSVITNNLVQHMSDAYGSMGIQLYNDFYASVTHNVINDVWMGMQVGNFSQANPDDPNYASLSYNTITAGNLGIFYNLSYAAATNFAVVGNNITSNGDPNCSTWFGMLLATSGLNETFTDNTIDGSGANAGTQTVGYDVWNTPASTITGGLVTGVEYGVWANSYEGYESAGGPTAVTLSGANITASQIGVYVEDSSQYYAIPSVPVSATIEGNTTISATDTGVGIKVDGPNATLQFSGTPAASVTTAGGNYITLLNTAEAGSTIDASGVTFGGYGGSVGGTTLAQFYGIEDQITDYLDDATVGYVKLNDGNVYVAYSSEMANAGAIQRGINVALTNDTVNVQAGTYVANSIDNPGGLYIAIPLTLSGAQAGMDPNPTAPALGAQTVIEPGAADANPYDANAVLVVYVAASNVTIDGVTVNGVNPLLAPNANTPLYNGSYIDASEGIVSYEGVGNITVQNNIIENTAYDGVDFYNYNNGGVATSGNLITQNLIENLSDAYGFGVGVILYNSFYADVTNNVMQNVTVGVQTGNFSNANPGSATYASIDHNQISASGVGIFFNLMYGSTSTISVSNNTITAVYSATDAPWQGVLISSIQGTVGVTFLDNSIDGTGAFTSPTQPSTGYEVWNTPTSGTVLISGGTVTGVDYGVWANTYEGYQSPGDATSVTVSGANITASQIGVYVEDSYEYYASQFASAYGGPYPEVPVSASIGGNTTITTTGMNSTAIEVDGPDATLQFSGNATNLTTSAAGNYITLAHGAEFGNTIDATAVSFNGTTGANATEPQKLAIAGKIYDALDDPTLGLVVWDASNTIFVTPATSPTATDNDFTRIANALALAELNGGTVVLSGTFDWSTGDAYTSWMNAGYELAVPSGANGVTLTADGLGDATIIGPGDVVGVPSTAFLAFTGTNTGWIISNLNIDNFALGIGFEGSSADEFDGTTISGNQIEVAANAPANYLLAGTTGILLGVGQNQIVEGNVIDLHGDDGPGTSEIAIESTPSAGSEYDGLMIDSNNIYVLHSTTPESLYGIFEYGDADNSDITVSGNTFSNSDLNNNPSANQQVAFYLTSPSSTYTNNTVSGANIGFQSYAGGGGAPTQFISNTLTNVENGFDFSNATTNDYLSGNTLTGTGSGGVGINIGNGSTVTMDDANGTTSISGFAAGVNFQGPNGGNDTLSVSYNGAIVSVSDTNGSSLTTPTGDVPTVSFTGVGGNNTLSIDGSNSNVSLSANYTPSASTTGSGSVVMSSGPAFDFTGLTPVDITGMASVTVNFPNAGSNAAVNEITGNGSFGVPNGTMAVSIGDPGDSVPIETAYLWNDTNVTVTTAGGDPGGLADSVTVNGVTFGDANITNFNISMGSEGPAGSTSVTFANGTTTLAGDLVVTSPGGSSGAGVAGNITVNSDVTSTDGSVAFTASQTIDLEANVTSGSGGSITFTANGTMGTILGANGAVNTPSLATTSTAGTYLTSANNNIGTFTADDSGGNITLTNNGALNIAGINETGTIADSVTVVNTGDIDVTSAVQTTSGSADTINFNATGNITLNANVSTPGSIIFTANGSISGMGAVLTAANLTTSSGNGTTLTNSLNQVSGLNATDTSTVGIDVNNSVDLAVYGATDTTTGPITITDAAGNISIAGNISADPSVGTVTLTAAAGSIAETGGIITAGNLVTNSATGTTLSGTTGGGGGGTTGTPNPQNISEQSPFPFLLSATPAVTPGGSLATGTYYFVVTAIVNDPPFTYYEDYESNELMVTLTGSENSVVLTWANQNDSGGYNIYQSTSSGNYNNVPVYSVDQYTTTFTDVGSGSGGGEIPNAVATFNGTDSGGGAVGITLVDGAGNLLILGANATRSAPVSLTNATGTITQSGPIVASTLTTSSVGGTTLTGPGNAVSTFHAADSGMGSAGVSFNNTVALTITGIAETGSGDVTVNNTGGTEINGPISATSGNISITDNTGGAYSGITIAGANISNSGPGSISFTGTGGSNVTFGSGQAGITALGNYNISSGGGISFNGTGGNSSGTGNDGVDLAGSGANIVNAAGNLSIDGNGSGTGASSIGVVVNAGTFEGGNISFNGTGGNTSGGGDGGISIGGGATVTTSAGDGAVTIMGNGSGTGSNNFGVDVANLGTVVTSGGGDVSITGIGGGAAANSSSSVNRGVIVEPGATVTSGANGTVMITGTSGQAGGSDNIGVQIGGNVTSGGAGDVTIMGTSYGTGGYDGVEPGNNSGVEIDGSVTSNTGNVAIGGNISITGVAGSSTSSNAFGVLIQGSVASGANGSVSITGTGGSTIDQTGSGIQLNAGTSSGASVTAPGTGSISFNGTGGSGSYDIYLQGNASSTASPVISANLGSIIIEGDSMYFDVSGGSANSPSISTTAGNVTLQTHIGSATDTTAVDLGGSEAPGSNTLALTNAELGIISAANGVLTIRNDSANSTPGNFNITQAINFNTSLVPTVALTTGANLTESGSGVITGGGNLAVTAVGNVNMAGNNTVSTLAANVTGSSSSLSFTNVGNLTVGSVNGVNGITTNAGNVTLTTNAGATPGLLTINDANNGITAPMATVLINSACGTSQVAGIITAGNLAVTGTGNFDLGVVNGVKNAVGTFAANVSGGYLAFDNNIALSIGNIGPVVGITDLGETVTLENNGDVTQTAIVTAGNLAVIDAGNVTLTLANNISVSGQLAANVTSANDTFSFNNAGDLTIGNVTTPSSTTVSGITTANGTVTVATNSGNLTVDANVAAGSADVRLFAGGAVGANMTLTNNAHITGGNALLEADKMELGNISLGDSVNVGTGNVRLRPFNANVGIQVGTVNSLADAFLDLSEVALQTVTGGILRIGNASAGNITITANIGLTTVGTLSLIGNGTVSETANNTISGANLSLDVQAAGNVTLTQNNNIGGNLAASVTGSGSTFSYTNIGNLTIGTADGIVGITANATIAVNTTAGNLNVNNNVTSGTADITLATGAATMSPELLTNSANITTTGGNITLTSDEMNLTVGSIISAPGAIVLLQPENPTTTIELGGNTGNGTLDLTTAELQTVQSAKYLRVGNTSAGNITVTPYNATASVTGLYPTTLTLITADSITSTANGSITVGNLALISGTGISGAGAHGGLSTFVNDLAFSNANGTVSVSNNVAVTGLKITGVDTLSTAINTNGGVILTEASPMEFNVTTSGAYITAYADDNNSGTGNITVDSNVTVSATNGDVDFEAGDNIFINANATVSATGNVTLTSDSPLSLPDGDGNQTLDGNISANITAGIVTISSPNVTTGSGVINQTGGAITANQLLLLSTGSNGSFTLTSANNSVTTIAANTTAPISFNDGASNLTVGTVNGPVGSAAGINSGGNNVTLTTTGGLTIGAGANESITANGATVVLNTAGATEANSSIVSAGNLLVEGTGNFTLNNNNTVGTLAASVAGAGNSLSFTNAGNLTVGSVTGVDGVTTNAGNVTLTTNAGGLLTINDANNGISAGNATVLINSAGGVTETAGNVTATNLQLEGTGTFNLSQTNNVSILASNTTGGPVTFNNGVSNLTVGTVITSGINTGGQNLTLTSGPLNINQNITATGSIVDITAAGATENSPALITAGSLRLRGTGNFTLNDNNNMTTLAANVTGNLAVTDSANLTVGTVPAAGTAGITTNGGSVTLTTNGSNLTLTVNNDIVTGNGSVTFNTSGAEALAANIAAGTGAVSLSATNGGMNQTAGTISGATLQVTTADASNVTLNDANDVTGNLAASLAGGNFAFTNNASLTIGTVTSSGITTSGGNVTLTTTGGNTSTLAVNNDIITGNGSVTFNTTGGETISANITAGTGTLTLEPAAGGANQTTGALTAGSLLVITNDASNVILDARTGGTPNNIINGNIAASMAGGNFTFSTNSSLTVGNVASTSGITTGPTIGNVTLTAFGNLTVNANITTGTGANGTLIQNGGFTNNATITPGNNTTITLNSTQDDIIINSNETFGTVTLTAPRDIIINATLKSTIGDITLVAGSAFNGTGAGGVWVDNTGSAPHLGVVTSAGNLTITGKDLFASNSTNQDAIRLEGPISANGTISLNTGANAPAGAGTFLGYSTATVVTSSNSTVNVNNPVTLTANATVAAAGNITFTSTIDGNQSLTVNGNGTTKFEAPIGNTTSLTSLTIDANRAFSLSPSAITDLNGGNITTTGNQTFNDAIVLTTNTTLTANTVITNNKVNDSANNTESLTIIGNANLGGSLGTNTIGVSKSLSSLTVTGATTINTSKITTSGANGTQNYDGAVTLGTTTSQLTGTLVTFGNTVDDVLGNSAQLTITGNATFDGLVGSNVALTNLTVTQTTTLNAGNANNTVTTDQFQQYSGSVLLGANATLVSTGNGTITFGQTVDAFNGSVAANLAVNTGGLTVFDGNVGASTQLASITTDAPGTTDLNAAIFNTTGAQTYNDSVTLTANTTLTSSQAGNITFNGTVDGNFSLAVNSNGTTTFAQPVGNTTALASVTVDPQVAYTSGLTLIDGGIVTTSGNQTYNDNTGLGANTTLTGGTIGFSTYNVSTGGTFLDATAASTYFLNINGNAIFNNDVGLGETEIAGGSELPLSLLTVSGSTDLESAPSLTIDTFGTQTYDGAVTLHSPAGPTLESIGSANITFNSTVNSFNSTAENLSIEGDAIFNASVGNINRLGSLTVFDTTTLNAGNSGNATVHTQSTQDYKGAVILGANSTLQVDANTSKVLFESTVNGISVGNQSLAIIGNMNLTAGAFIGSSTALSSLTVSANSTLTAGNNGSNTVTTTGLQSYNGAVTLGANTTLASTSSGNIAFNSTIDGPVNLAVNTSGVTIFGGNVGVTTALASVTTDAPGTTDLNGSVFNTTGAQTFNDAVVLSSNETLSSSNNGTIAFWGTVDGNFTLTVNTSGLTAFHGNVGATTALASITTDAPGTTDLNGAVIDTTGVQTYNDAVVLTHDETLSSNNTGNVTFNNTLDGTFNLTVNTGGYTVFDGNVGATTALASITTDMPGTTDLNGAVIITTGAQTYNDNIVLTHDESLTSTNGNITFNGNINTNGYNLTINSNGTTVIEGNITGSNLTFGPNGTTDLNGSSVTTTGSQSYLNAVVLTHDETLTSTGNGSIAFSKTLDGDYNLTVNTGGLTAFDGNVGSGTVLASVVTDAPGTTDLNGSVVITTGVQTYNDAVVLTHDESLTSHNAGITFNSTLNSDGTYRNLSLSATGDIVANGNVGASMALANVTVTQAANLTFVGTITTTGNVTQSTGNGTTTFNGGTIGGNLSVVTKAIVINTGTLTVNGGQASLTANNGTIIENSGTISVGNLTTSSANGTSMPNVNAVSSYSGTNSGTGDIAFKATAANLTVTNLTDSAAGGNVSVNNVGGNLTLSGNVTTSGTAGLEANGSISQSGGMIMANTLGAVDTGTTTTSNITLVGNVSNFGALNSANLGQVNFTGTNSSGLVLTTVGAFGVFTGTGAYGVSTNNGDMTLIANAGALTVAQPLNSGNGSNGTLSIIGGVNLAANISVGAGNITLQGVGNNITITGNTIFNVPVSLTAYRDILVEAGLATTNGNLTLTAGSAFSGNGAGGVYVFPAGSLYAAGNLAISGKDLYYTPGTNQDAIRLEGTGNNLIDPGSGANVEAGGNITLTTGANAPVGAGTFLDSTVDSDSGSVSVNNRVVVESNSTVNTSGGSITFASTIDGNIAATYGLTLNAEQSGNVTGNISVAGNVGSTANLSYLTVTDANNLTFSGAVFTSGSVMQTNGNGTTTLNGGSIGSLTVNTVNVTLNNALTVAGNTSINITGNGAVNGTINSGTSPANSTAISLTGGGTFTLASANRFSSGYNDVNVGANTTVNFSNSNQTFGSLASNASTSKVVLGSGTLTTGQDAANTTFAGNISGTGGVIKVGTSNFTLSGVNAYTGPTTINGGLLTLGTNNALSASTNVTINAGNLAMNGFNDSVGGVNLISGNITGAGTLTSATLFNVQSGLVSANLAGSVGLTKSANATVVFTSASTNTYTGNTTVSAGTLTMNGTLSTSSASVLMTGAGTVLNGTGTIGRGVIVNALNVTVGSGTIGNSGNVTPGTAGLTIKTNAGTGVTVNSGYSAAILGDTIETGSGYNDYGITINGGKALIQDDNLSGVGIQANTSISQPYYGIVTVSGGIVDAGQVNGGVNFTGILGAATGSDGNNKLSGYQNYTGSTLPASLTHPVSQAIIDDNTNSPNNLAGPKGQPYDLYAQDNNFGYGNGNTTVLGAGNMTYSPGAGNYSAIEAVVYGDYDYSGVGFINYVSPTTTSPTLVTTMFYSVNAAELGDQLLTFTNFTSNENFNLTLNGLTATVAYGSSVTTTATNIQNALVNNLGLGSTSNVLVVGTSSGSTATFTVTFMGAFAQVVEPALIPSGLPGGTSLTVDTFADQRSMIRRMALVFTNYVTIGSTAVSVTMEGMAYSTSISSFSPGMNVTLTATQIIFDPYSGQFRYEYSFSGNGTESSGSLTDGEYRLNINSANITSYGGGSLMVPTYNPNSAATPNFNAGVPYNTSTSIYTLAFHREFGDLDGIGYIDANDISAMTNALGRLSSQAGYLADLDYNNDGSIDTTTDQAQFNMRKTKYNAYGMNTTIGWQWDI